MWVVAEYEATSLFTLKASAATSSGAKTLLVPTPYSVKMALLDVVCRTEGEVKGRQAWNWLRALRMGLRPAQRVVVSNLFEKVLKPRRDQSPEGGVDQGPYQRTISYREYAQLCGPVGIALGEIGEEPRARELARWMTGISYLGRRGSFVQLCATPRLTDALPDSFISIALDARKEMPRQGAMQMLDDCDPGVPFDRVSIYSDEPMRRDKDRVFHHVVLPYRVYSSSRGYTAYERIDV